MCCTPIQALTHLVMLSSLASFRAAAFRPAHNQAAARDYYPHRGPSRSNTL